MEKQKLNIRNLYCIWIIIYSLAIVGLWGYLYVDTRLPGDSYVIRDDWMQLLLVIFYCVYSLSILVIPFVISYRERTLENRSWFISTIREKSISIGMILGGITFFISGFFSKLSIFRVWNIEGDTVFDTYSGIVWARSTETINNVFGYIFLGLLVLVIIFNLILLIKDRKKENN